MKTYVEDKSVAARRREIDSKVGRIQGLLEKEGLNALYLTKQPGFSWITAGANGCVTICVEDAIASVLVTREGKRYLLTNIIEHKKMIEDELVEELGFEVLSSEWYENRNAEWIESIAGSLAMVGSDIPFGGCRVIQSDILPMQYSLTDNEIGRYQYLGDRMSEALEAYLATVKPGMSEFEITGGIANALWPHEIGQVLYMVMTDRRAYDRRHGTPTGKKLDKLLMVSCNGRYKGLITTTTRMVHFGEPPKGFIKQYEDTCEVSARMIAVSKPGTDDIIPHREGKKAYEDLGVGEMYFKHAQGGPQGYYNRYYNVSESVHAVIQPNQCYCYQPVIDGTKVEDAFIATAEGPLMVTKPKSFPKVVKTVGDVTVTFPGLLVID
jgi:Xaa-Pro aminopeptidase